MIEEVEELASHYTRPATGVEDTARFSYLPKAHIEHTLHIDDRGDYVMSDWARAQINTAMGARDKWFNAVSQTEQADERNKRLYIFRNKRLLLSQYDDEPCGMLRGVVSTGYRDIPYTFIVNKLADALPAGAGSNISAKWSFVDYRVLHVLHVSTEVHTLPGTTRTWSPGLLVRSSEVGEASLTVYPVVSFGDSMMPILLKELPRACRIRHNNGSLEHVESKFVEGLLKATEYFTEPRAMRLLSLQKIKYADEEEALEALRSACRAVRITRRLEDRLVAQYQLLDDQDHSGIRILLALQDAADEMLSRDEIAAADFTTWIGSLLYQL